MNAQEDEREIALPGLAYLDDIETEPPPPSSGIDDWIIRVRRKRRR